MFLLNSLKTPDIVFFSLIVAFVVICIAIYLLIPVIKKKEFEERRENLKKREAVFRANLKTLKGESVQVEEAPAEEETPVEEDKANDGEKGNNEAE